MVKVNIKSRLEEMGVTLFSAQSLRLLFFQQAVFSDLFAFGMKSRKNSFVLGFLFPTSRMNISITPVLSSFDNVLFLKQ